jgi:hypothetical protein
VFVTSCWIDAFVCVACSLMVAVICTERFAMCKEIWCLQEFQALVVRIFICCEAGKPVGLQLSILCRHDSARCEAPLVCFLDEQAQVDPHLFIKWLALPVLNVPLVQAALRNEAKCIEE